MSNPFTVVHAANLNGRQDAYLGLPVENTNKQTFWRVPIRSSMTETLDGRRVRIQLLPGHDRVVQNTQGMQRLVVRFPECYVPGAKVYDGSMDSGNNNNNNNERVNITMGFALYDARNGPTPEQQRVLDNIDAFAAFLRETLYSCDKIRCALKLGPANMSPDQQRVAAEMLDVFVSRAVSAPPSSAAGGGDNSERARSRYLYTKLVSPETPNLPPIFHTYFYTRDGRPVPFETVLGWRNFHAEPLVEMEDVFVFKAVRSLQIKLRECLVTPPAERPNTRYSMCFPDQLCATGSERVTAEVDGDGHDNGNNNKRPSLLGAAGDELDAPPKRMRLAAQPDDLSGVAGSVHEEEEEDEQGPE